MNRKLTSWTCLTFAMLCFLGNGVSVQAQAYLSHGISGYRLNGAYPYSGYGLATPYLNDCCCRGRGWYQCNFGPEYCLSNLYASGVGADVPGCCHGCNGCRGGCGYRQLFGHRSGCSSCPAVGTMNSAGCCRPAANCCGSASCGATVTLPGPAAPATSTVAPAPLSSAPSAPAPAGVAPAPPAEVLKQ